MVCSGARAPLPVPAEHHHDPADDPGYADISACKIDRFQIPNIDRVGTQVVRFTDGDATAPVCGPSRAGLLTGRYQDRFGFEYNNGGAQRDLAQGPGSRWRSHRRPVIERRRLSHRPDWQVAPGQPRAVLSDQLRFLRVCRLPA